MGKLKPDIAVYGIGVGPRKGTLLPEHRRAYKTWSGMLERCYSKRSAVVHPTYVGVTVNPEWHAFADFLLWFEDNYVPGYALDKDLKNPGCREYSANNCVFVPQWLNNLFIDSLASRGNLPAGVTRDHKKFKARFTAYGKSIYLGMFTTAHEAYGAYCKAKGDYLLARAREQEVPHEIVPSIIQRANVYLGGAVCP